MPEIVDTNLSRAWQRAVTLADASPGKEVTNLIVSIEDLFGPTALENESTRSALDTALAENRNFQVSTVASTIFPLSLWRPDAPRDELYHRYLRLWPRISSFPQNRRGTYFQRLISFPSPEGPRFNQLEFVISAFSAGIRRRSALQCGILHPPTDLNATPYQGFPCMQQISFHKEGTSGLRVSALYPMHYLWARAYGNYLGIVNLGRFMAKEMGLRLNAITCIAIIAKLDEPSLAGPFLGDPNELC